MYYMAQVTRTRVTEGGRIVIPAEFRRQLGIVIGEEVNLSMDSGELRVSTAKAALKRLQSRAKAAVQTSHSVVNELIAERRKEGERE